jgi:hypothetical protein
MWAIIAKFGENFQCTSINNLAKQSINIDVACGLTTLLSMVGIKVTRPGISCRNICPYVWPPHITAYVIINHLFLKLIHML